MLKYIITSCFSSNIVTGKVTRKHSKEDMTNLMRIESVPITTELGVLKTHLRRVTVQLDSITKCEPSDKKSKSKEKAEEEIVGVRISFTDNPIAPNDEKCPMHFPSPSKHILHWTSF
jgi:hypothetical protein